MTTTSFSANWGAAAGAASYQLDVSTVSRFASFVMGYNNLAVAATSKRITSLSAGTTYFFRVRGINGAAVSSVTGLIGGTTYYYRLRGVNASGASVSGTTATALTLPPWPSGLNATTIQRNSFTANWAAATSATSYLLFVATDASFTNFLSGYNGFSLVATSKAINGTILSLRLFWNNT